jgi:ABC-2 type transport system permease protein
MSRDTAEQALPVPGAPDVVTRTIATKTLWENRRGLVGWPLAIAAVGAVYGGFWPSMNTPEMQEAVRSFPPELLEALSYNDMTTPAGYIGSAVYGMLAAVLVTVMTIMQGARAVAGDEEDGLLDLLLAHPVRRSRVALERFAAVAVTVVLAAIALWLVMIGLSGPAHLDGISVGAFAAASVQLTLFGLTHGAVAFAVGAATGRRGLAVATASAVAVVGYLANGVLPQVRSLAWTRDVSPWHWYVGGAPLRHGLQLGDCGLMLAVTIALVALGTWLFTRRDIGV